MLANVYEHEVCDKIFTGIPLIEWSIFKGHELKNLECIEWSIFKGHEFKVETTAKACLSQVVGMGMLASYMPGVYCRSHLDGGSVY